MTPKLRILIPLLIMVCCAVYTMTLISLYLCPLTWRRGIALLLLVSLFHYYFTWRKGCVVFTGIYLLLATFNVISIGPDNTVFFVQLGSVQLPDIQLVGLGLLIVYSFLNVDQLAEMYADYKAAKAQKKEQE